MPCPSRLSAAALLAVALAAHGDEAVRRDGTRLTGRLRLSEGGRIAFGDEPVGNLERVRFSPKPPAPPPVPLWHQVHLGRGQVVLAEVRSLDDKALRVRPAWAEALAVPRAAVEQVTNAPGWRPVRFDTFTGGKLALDAAVPPLAAGRVLVTGRPAVTKGRRVSLDLGFVRDGRPAAVRVELSGPGEQFAITAPDQAHHEGRIKRGGEATRIAAEFDRDRLVVTVGEWVLWSRDAGPGELRSVKLVSEGDASEPVAIESLVVARPEPIGDLRAWADLTADAIRSPEGDETYGSLTAAGPAGATLEVKGKGLTLGWPDVAGFTFRRAVVTEQPTRGEHVRVLIHTADGQRDVLDGAVKALDDKALVLVHPILGELSVPRDRLEEVRFAFHGRRVPIDGAPHHLGTKPAFGFSTPKPEGMQLLRTINVDKPAPGFIVVEAAWLGRMGTPAEVRVNGEVVGELNRLADRADGAVREYRLPVERWRTGDNEVEVRLRPAGSGKVAGIDLRALWAEWPEPR
jgi:hypothetical protein